MHDYNEMDGLQNNDTEQEQLNKNDGVTYENKENIEGVSEEAEEESSENESNPVHQLQNLIGNQALLNKISEDPDYAENLLETNKRYPVEFVAEMRYKLGIDINDLDISYGQSNLEALGGRASARGNQLNFAQSSLDFNNPEDKKLFLHEVAHVIQQKEGNVQAESEENGMLVNRDERYEAEANNLANGFDGMGLGSNRLNVSGLIGKVVQFARHRESKQQRKKRLSRDEAWSYFTSKSIRVGDYELTLDKAAMKHFFIRHHPNAWDGSVKGRQTFFDKRMTVDDIEGAIRTIISDNRTIVIENESSNERVYQLTGEFNNVEYTLGVTYGRIGQFYPNR